MKTEHGRRYRTAAVAVIVVAATLPLFAWTLSGRGDPNFVALGSGHADAAAPAALDASDPRWPSSISNRKVLDQFGDVYLARTFSSWGMASNLSNTQITTALEGVAADGFNGVTVWIGGGANYGAGWTPTYVHKATGQAFWAGTPWASSLGPAWGSLDHLVAEAQRLGIFVWMSLNGGFGTFGARADWEGVTDTSMHNAGAAVAARYRSAPNIGWHVMLDDGTRVGDPAGQRVEAFFAGVDDTEGSSARPVRWLEVGNGSTTDDQGWLGSPRFNATINSSYRYTGNSTELAEGTYADVSTVPVGDCEPPYDGAPHYAGNSGQQLRERSYATFLEGGSLINYGHEDWWRFGLSGLYSEGLTWQQVPTHSHTVQQSYAWSLLDQYVADKTWAPDGAFLTTGTGSGETKAAAGHSTTAAVAYFPSARTVVVDTTVIGGAGPVRLRWFDPTAGTYTTIATSEPQQTNRALPYPSAHADGSEDWMLVVDGASDSPVTTSTSTTTTTAPTTTSSTSTTTTTTTTAPTTTSSTTTTSTTTSPSTTTTTSSTTTSSTTTTIAAPATTLPSEPRSLIAIARNKAVKLFWLAPLSNGGESIFDYVEQYSADGGQTWTTVVDAVTSSRRVAVHGLVDGANYQFRVAAVTTVGQGPWSSAVSATAG